MSYKLVVAEASPSAQKVLQLAFSAPDWDLVIFDNGLELTKKIFEVHPDGLLVSLALPGLDGYSVARFVRKQEEFRHTALVFLKGAFETFDPQRAEAVDYDEIIAKPFDSATLTVRMKNLIEAKGEHSHFPESPIPTEAAAKPPAPKPLAPQPPSPQPPSPNPPSPKPPASKPPAPKPPAPKPAEPTPAEPAAPSKTTAPPAAPSPAPTPASLPIAPSVPPTPSAPLAAPTPAASAEPAVGTEDLERRLQEWLKGELVLIEREVEKRVRQQITIELKRWFAEHFISVPSKER